MAKSEHAAKEIIRSSFDALNDRDRESFVEHHADDFVLHDAGETIEGPEASSEYMWAFFEAFPDMSFTLDTIIAEGNLVSVRGVWTGTHEAEFEGIEPTGNEIEVAEMGLFRVEDRLVVEAWAHSDRLGLLEQLGVIEPPGE